MKKMTVEEAIDKLANTKIYTRGRGVEVINKIYPLFSKLEFKVEEYDIFPFFELIKEEGDSSMLHLKPYYSMYVFSTCEFKEMTPEEILDIEFEDKKEDNPNFETIEMPFRVGDKVSFLLDNRVHEDVIQNINIDVKFLSDGKRDVKYWFLTDTKTLLEGELFHTTEELLNDLKNKTIITR
jgi:hypothetical protein